MEAGNTHQKFDFDVEATTDSFGNSIPFCASVNSLPDGPCSIPVPALLCPSDGVGGVTSTLYTGQTGFRLGVFNHSNYLGFFGDKNQGAFFAGPRNKRAAFGVEYGARLADIKDGASNTMIVGEYLTGLPEEDAPNDMRGVHWFDIPGTSQLYTQSGPNSSNPDLIFPASWCYSEPESNLPCAATSQDQVTAASRSRHPGGVYVLMGDGSVSFKPDSIALKVWQAMGSIDGHDVVPGQLLAGN